MKKEGENKVMATATLMTHTGKTKLANLSDLKKIKTPVGTKTWTPIPHIDIIRKIEKRVTDHGWKFLEEGDKKFQIAISDTGDRLFGVTLIAIPGIDDQDMKLAVGFRNSHDKTMALTLAVGSHVGVCDNMMISGDLKVRRVHTVNISLEEVLDHSFEMIPGAGKHLFTWMNELKVRTISTDEGVSLLAQYVEKHALPIQNFMDAREAFLKAQNNANPLIKYGNTVWAAYQAVTEQLKKHSMSTIQYYCENLNKVTGEKVGMLLN